MSNWVIIMTFSSVISPWYVNEFCGPNLWPSNEILYALLNK
jgi:hypothetical protein